MLRSVIYGRVALDRSASTLLKHGLNPVGVCKLSNPVFHGSSRHRLFAFEKWLDWESAGFEFRVLGHYNGALEVVAEYSVW
jgi:hypothetical protein